MGGPVFEGTIFEDEPGCHFGGKGAQCLEGSKLKNTNCHSVDKTFMAVDVLKKMNKKHTFDVIFRVD